MRGADRAQSYSGESVRQSAETVPRRRRWPLIGSPMVGVAGPDPVGTLSEGRRARLASAV